MIVIRATGVSSRSGCETAQQLGARLRGRTTATQRSKKGTEQVLGRALGKDSQNGSEKGACDGFTVKKGPEKGDSRRPRTLLGEYDALGVRPKKRVSERVSLGVWRRSPKNSKRPFFRTVCNGAGPI